MEASERHQFTLNRTTPSGAQSRRIRLLDPAAIDFGSASGLARLGLMVGPVFDRLTAVELAPGSDA